MHRSRNNHESGHCSVNKYTAPGARSCGARRLCSIACEPPGIIRVHSTAFLCVAQHLSHRVASLWKHQESGQCYVPIESIRVYTFAHAPNLWRQ